MISDGIFKNSIKTLQCSFIQIIILSNYLRISRAVVIIDITEEHFQVSISNLYLYQISISIFNLYLIYI